MSIAFRILGIYEFISMAELNLITWALDTAVVGVGSWMSVAKESDAMKTARVSSDPNSVLLVKISGYYCHGVGPFNLPMTLASRVLAQKLLRS